jgi:hypothetical protein
MLALGPARPSALVRESVEHFLMKARDKGLTVVKDASDDLPEVMADAEKIRHVFAILFQKHLDSPPPWERGLYQENLSFRDFHTLEKGRDPTKREIYPDIVLEQPTYYASFRARTSAARTCGFFVRAFRDTRSIFDS